MYGGMLPAGKLKGEATNRRYFVRNDRFTGEIRNLCNYIHVCINVYFGKSFSNVTEFFSVKMVRMLVGYHHSDDIFWHDKVMGPDARVNDERVAVFGQDKTSVGVFRDLHTVYYTSIMTNKEFQEQVWHKGRELFRPMPWREEPSLYNVLVSELMLQQTQVARVIPKFQQFMVLFPDVQSLAAAELGDVLRAWQGLGYNRRAKFLHAAAEDIVVRGEPKTYAELVALPGVGKHTAGAILNYVYEVPTPFVETNIRTVYFHHFFEGATAVSDNELLALVESTLESEHPREWFWALMDYGAELKRAGLGRLDVSKHYKKQSPLKGSVREMRGRILRALGDGPHNLATLKTMVAADDRFLPALSALESEGLVRRHGSHYTL